MPDGLHIFHGIGAAVLIMAAVMVVMRYLHFVEFLKLTVLVLVLFTVMGIYREMPRKAEIHYNQEKNSYNFEAPDSKLKNLPFDPSERKVDPTKKIPI